MVSGRIIVETGVGNRGLDLFVVKIYATGRPEPPIGGPGSECRVFTNNLYQRLLYFLSFRRKKNKNVCKVREPESCLDREESSICAKGSPNLEPFG